ncbi:MAG: lysylphosphatidylglycerol synthase transmembrane domain-containing protein, partial [Pseudomonadota bacterium]
MAQTAVVKRLGLSAAVLLAVALLLDPRAIIREVQGFSLAWLVLGLAISILQVLLCAWRWRLTAGLVGTPLRYRYAVAEYYLSLFINQVLPGGVLGDAGRALRHAQQTSKRGSAWRAVIIERASGQLAVALLTALALVSSPLWQAALGKNGYLWLAAGMVSVVLCVAFIAAVIPERVHLPGWVSALWADIQRGLWHGGVWAWQLASSLMIVFSYALVMLCAARAIGVELPASVLLALAPPLLLSMLIPLSVAGWGLREGTAASVWAWVGLAPSQGVAVSLAYGVIVLIATLPGLWVALMRRRRATPAGSGFVEPTAAQAEVKQGVIPTAEAPR